MLYLAKGGSLKKFALHPHDYTGGHTAEHYIPYLMELLELEPGTTLSDFLSPAFKYAGIYSDTFSSHLGHVPLEAFAPEFNLPSIKPLPDIDTLHLNWDTHCESPSSLFPPLLNMPIASRHHLFSTKPVLEGFSSATNTYQSVEFMPLNALKGLPLVLNPSFRISTYQDETETVLFEAVNPFTVYDALAAVLFEISFYGSPADRKAMKADFDRRLKAVKNSKFMTTEDVIQSVRSRSKN